MADIFISYASGNRRKVSILASLFEDLGWSVWWDRDIKAGHQWSAAIESELEKARCVVVAWSRSAIDSDWVLREARAGQKRGVLIPVLLEPVEPPAEFSRVQAARLTAWAESSESEELGKLLSRLSEVLDLGSRQMDTNRVRETTAEISRIEAAEASFEYCAAFFAFAQKKDSQSAERLRPAYEGLVKALSPISDEDLHELIEGYLKEFAP